MTESVTPTPSSPGAAAPASPLPEPDPSRAGAIWVTATGALLLLAAAVVFVAVHWDSLEDAGKLAVIMAATGGFLVAGRALRRTLPATSSVLYHLGAFLVPVNVAAVAVHAGWSGSATVLAEGLTGAVLFPVLNRVERSAVLRWVAVAAVGAAALGAGGLWSVPAAVLLAGIAVAAELLRSHVPADGPGTDGPAAAWAIAGGFAPAAALATGALQVREPVTAALGLRAAGAPWSPAVAAVLSAVVLGRIAHRRRDLLFVVLAGGAVAVGAAATVQVAAPGADTVWAAAALAFLAAEVAAARTGRDPFWGRPARTVALATEVAALAAVGFAADGALAGVSRALGLARPILTGVPGGRPDLLIVGAVAVVAWLVADQRRRLKDRTPAGVALLVGGGWWPAVPAITATVLVATWWATASTTVLATTAVALAALAVASGRPLAHPVAAALVVVAPAVVDDRWLAAGLALAGAAALTWAAALRLETRTVGSVDAAGALHAAAVLTVGATAANAAVHGWPHAQVLVGAALVAWATAVGVDPAASRLDAEARRAGDRAVSPLWITAVGRMAAVASLLGLPWLGRTEVVVLATALVVTIAADALVLRRPAGLSLAAAPVPIIVVTLGLERGLPIGETGVASAVVAVLAGGAAVALSAAGRRAWALPVAAIAASSATVGLALGLAEAGTFATVLLLLGGLAAAAGLARRDPIVGFGGAAVMLLGAWVHLAVAHVHALDAYAAPVAAVLLVAGLVCRRRDHAAAIEPAAAVSSWVAYGPAILGLGLTALLERIDHGDGIHAIVAGAVGVVAVLAGGSRRLAGPLLLGTVLLVATAWHEVLAVPVGVPQWAWLAAGGAVLVAAGVVLERHDTGPLETGRRLADTIHERYS